MKRSLSESTLSLAIINELDDIKQSENNVVLFGSVGNGKTYLLNKACGANFLTSDSGYSCTRNIQFEYSLKYDMVIIDFPGLNAVQDIIGHLKVQKTALSAIPVRMICFVIKYSPRYDDLERELGQMLSIFDNYIKNILIIVTKSEEADFKRKEEIQFLFKSKFNIGHVLFTTKKINGYDLCYELNKVKSKMENIKQIVVKTRDLVKAVPSLYNKDMAKERELYEDKFYEVLELFKKEVENAVDPDLKRALYFAFKDYKTILLEEYTNVIRNKKINGNEPDMDSVIAEVLMFDNKIFNEFNEFRKQIESKIEIKSSNYNGEYNRFKKCPHCGLIWFKIKGCDSVQCGKRSKVTDKIIGKYKKYTVKFINKKIVISSEDLGSDLDIKNKESRTTVILNPYTSINQKIQLNNNNNNHHQINSQKDQSNNNEGQNELHSNQINQMNNNYIENIPIGMNLINDDNQMNIPKFLPMNMQMNQINNNMNKIHDNNQEKNNINNKNGNMKGNKLSIISKKKKNNIHQKTTLLNRSNNNRIYRNNENEDEFIGLTKKEKMENEEREKSGKVKINPLGCGRNLDWKEMEDCSDEVIEKLKEIAVDDYFSGLMKINDEIKK